MGRAARWLKGLLGMKNGKEHEQISNSDKKEKKRWSFAKSGRDCAVGNQIPVTDTAWLRSYIAETEKEQNKHAIAVAAATAAAADAAVAAAQAAVAVVRLTSNGRGTLFGGGRERLAAEKIQAVFRGYLARKALRALKGLVKLQALVRGYLVRKRANATLDSMRALIRAQTSARFQRARRSTNKDNRLQPEIRYRKSTERFDDARNEFHSKRLFASYESTINAFDESAKIVEIDTFKPRSRSRRINTSIAFSESSKDPPGYYAVSSPLPCPIPDRISVLQDFDWSLAGDECRSSTAQSTPRLANSVQPNAPATPSKSVCGDCYSRPYSNFPNYMTNTKSFKAKLRSHSAPKQRPEPGLKKKLALNELMAARNSISSVRMQRSSSQVQESQDY